MPKGRKEFYQYAGWIASASFGLGITAEVVPLRTDHVVSPRTGIFVVPDDEIPKDLDAVIFTGGADISDHWYDPRSAKPVPDRDLAEAFYFKQFRDKLPILGICRGMQLINCLMGGNLIQDLSESAGYFPHKDGQHKIFLTDGRVFESNSFHHQSVGMLAPGLTVVAKAGDGVIEMAECPGIHLVQFHPERAGMCWDELSTEIFRKIIV
jgi:gamma-glutamyl-gamma-aminobutyrate hydrolase PuuD